MSTTGHEGAGRLTFIRRQPVTREVTVEEVGARSATQPARPLFGNQIRWAKRVIAETLKQRRADA